MRRPSKQQIALAAELILALAIGAILIAFYFDPPEGFMTTRIF